MSYKKYMIIVYLTSLSSILSPFQHVSYIEYMIFVFNYFLFNLVAISGCEFHEVHNLCLTIFSCNLVNISASEFQKVRFF